MREVKQQRPFYQRWWFLTSMLILLISIMTIYHSETARENDHENSEQAERVRTELPEKLQHLQISDVPNDAAGNWHMVVEEQDFHMPENALAYHLAYMADDEVHYLVSLVTSTTTRINEIEDILSITITEYVEGEEHSADTIGSGTTLEAYNVFKDSQIIQEVTFPQ